MIQRIQTIYLLIAALLVAMLFFLPFAEIASQSGIVYNFDANGIIQQGEANGEKVYDSLPVNILSGIALAMLVLIISQFKNRIRQIRLSTVVIFILIGLTGLIVFYAWKSASIIDGKFTMEIATAFPLVAAVFIYLAIRAIAKDEILVRSVDRIR